MNREEWLNERRTGIGGSDAAAVMGLNPWKSPLDVYLDKTGQLMESPDNPALYWGRVLEEVVAREYSLRTRTKVRRKNRILRHRKHPWMLANLDRVIVGGRGILECKTTARTEGWGPSGSDEIPLTYYLQLVHYLAVTGSPFADLAVLIGGRDFRTYRVHPDDRTLEHLIDREYDFWINHVLVKNPPEPQTESDLAWLYPKDQGSTLVADSELKSAISHYLKLKDEEKQIHEKKKDLEVLIKQEVKQHAQVLDHKGRQLLSWKHHDHSRFDSSSFKQDHDALYQQYSKTSTRRVLRVG